MKELSRYSAILLVGYAASLHHSQTLPEVTRSMCGCRETVRLTKRLHQYDVMRANKAPFAFGLEPRVPFLDKEFLDVSMTLDPADKMVSSWQGGHASVPSQIPF